MARTITHHVGDETLVVERCWCGCLHAVPKSLSDLQIRQHNDGDQNVHGIYCPLGHVWVPSGEGECDRLRRKLRSKDHSLLNEIQKHDQTKTELRETEARRRAEKAAKTGLKNRVSKGVCPCCNRSFVNLQRHMENQHPEWTSNDHQH